MTGSVDPVDPDDLVWHYTDGHGLVSILSGHALWATSSAFLNDRQEIALGGDLVARRIRELADGDESGVLARLAEKVVTSTEHGEGPGTADFYILSASRHHDSLAMWRLYGGAAESYAIGLDPDAPLAVLGDADLPVGRENGLYLHHEPWQRVRYDEAEQVALRSTASSRPCPGSSNGWGRSRATRPSTRSSRRRPSWAARWPASSTTSRRCSSSSSTRASSTSGSRATGSSWSPAAASGAASRRSRPRLLSYRPTAYGIAPFVRLTGGDPDGGVGQVRPDPSPLPVRAVAISPSPNGRESTASLRRLLVRHGYDVPVLRSGIPFRG